MFKKKRIDERRLSKFAQTRIQEGYEANDTRENEQRERRESLLKRYGQYVQAVAGRIRQRHGDSIDTSKVLADMAADKVLCEMITQGKNAPYKDDVILICATVDFHLSVEHERAMYFLYLDKMINEGKLDPEGDVDKLVPWNRSAFYTDFFFSPDQVFRNRKIARIRNKTS